MYLSRTSRKNPKTDGRNVHPSAGVQTQRVGAKCWGGLAASTMLALAAITHPHFCFWVWQSLYLSLAPQQQGTEGFVPACPVASLLPFPVARGIF